VLLFRLGARVPNGISLQELCGRNLLGVQMSCKFCASDNLVNLTGELTASLPDLNHLSAAPIYACREVLVCLDCGFTELRLLPPELEQLRKSREAAT